MQRGQGHHQGQVPAVQRIQGVQQGLRGQEEEVETVKNMGPRLRECKSKAKDGWDAGSRNLGTSFFVIIPVHLI